MRAAQRGQLTQSRSGCGPLASNSGTWRKNQAGKRFLQWLVTLPVEAITTGRQKATSKLQRWRSREKELDKLAARQVIRGQKKPVSETACQYQERDRMAAKN